MIGKERSVSVWREGDGGPIGIYTICDLCLGEVTTTTSYLGDSRSERLILCLPCSRLVNQRRSPEARELNPFDRRGVMLRRQALGVGSEGAEPA
jgi:hypothetical protein